MMINIKKSIFLIMNSSLNSRMNIQTNYYLNKVQTAFSWIFEMRAKDSNALPSLQAIGMSCMADGIHHA